MNDPKKKKFTVQDKIMEMESNSRLSTALVVTWNSLDRYSLRNFMPAEIEEISSPYDGSHFLLE